MKTIEIPADLYTELLEKALEMNYRTPADVIRFLLHQRKSEIAASDSSSNSINQQLVTRGGPLPNGIKLRAAYKGRTFSAIVERGAIVTEGKQFRSPSAAAIYIAKLQGTPNPSINGWKFWEYFDSSANHWKILENLRDILGRNGGRSVPVPSKVGEEMMAYSFAHAFDMPISIVRSTNIIGETQHPEKFIPNTIKSILNNQKVVLHGKNKEKGLVEERNGKWLANQVFLSPIEHYNIF